MRARSLTPASLPQSARIRYASLGCVAALALACVAACDASSTVQGGQALTTDPCASPEALTPTWHDLYQCYFGPSGKASCTAQGFCHGSPTEQGGGYSQFICGSSSLECWQGMTIGEIICPGVGDASADGQGPSTDAALDGAALDGAPAHDGGGDSGACNPNPTFPPGCMLAYQPIVPTCGTGDPSMTLLWYALRGAPTPAGAPAFNNMPYVNSGTGFTFSPQDLDLISAWIRGGAKYN